MGAKAKREPEPPSTAPVLVKHEIHHDAIDSSCAIIDHLIDNVTLHFQLKAIKKMINPTSTI